MLLLMVTLVTFLAASSAPTPLYRLYRDAWGFSPAILTVIFAIYAFGLLLSLLVTGSLSDYIGRRKVIMGALALEMVSMVLFLVADSVPWLIAARIAQGLATGAATSALGAALLDVSRTRGPLVNSVSPIIGTGTGALLSSVLVQFAPWPTHLGFSLLLCALVAQSVLMLRLPETAGARAGAWRSLLPRLEVPHQARSALLRVSMVNVAVWALGGFYLSLGPTLAAMVTGSQAAMVGGLMVACLTSSGAIAVLMLRNAQGLTAMRIGASSLALGLPVSLFGVHGGGAWFFYLGTLFAGVGFGSAFLGALRTVMPLAEPHQRAGLMATFYVVSYLGMSLPVMAAGVAATHIGLIRTMDIYGCMLILLAVGALLSTRGASTRSTAPAS